MGFFGEDSDDELSLLVRLEGGRDDDVRAGREPEPDGHLAEVDERLGSPDAAVVPEEVRVQRAAARVADVVHGKA